MLFWAAYLVLLFAAFMGFLAAAWSFAVQSFILSCVVLGGLLFARRLRRSDKDEYVHWSQHPGTREDYK